MAANDVIELDSGSSDDEFQDPPRKPIGWNYQLKTSKDDKEKNDKANGAVHKTDDLADDPEIVEVKCNEDKSKPSKEKVHPKLPISSTRSEIRKIIRNTSQSTLSDFFEREKKNNKSENIYTDKTNCEKENKYNSLQENDDKTEDIVEENSETSIAALERFVCRWEEVKSGRDDFKIRDKLWKYYYLSHSSYTHSRKFIDMIEGATCKLSVDNIYVVIKDILDSLKRYKDVPFGDKRQRASGDDSTGEGGVASPLPEETEEDRKRNSRLRKVEKKMKEISDKIKELESSEVDFDDETNSAYLVEERLKRQFSKLHDYYCKVANCSSATGRPIERKFRYQGSRWTEVNKRITIWVNKTKEFPDYVDILNLLKKVTKQSSLPLRPETVRVQAQEIFRDVGRMLKERRESDDLYNIYSYADDDIEDPALKNEELNQKLTENESIAKDKLDKIFQEFVDKDAAVRESNDANSEKKKNSKKESQEKKLDENNVEGDREKKHDGEEQETAKEDIEEKEEQDVDDDADDDILVDVYDDDDEEDDDEDDDIEEIYDEIHEKAEMQNVQQHNLIYDDDVSTDDDLKNVLASACFEEEIEYSEEDVPVIDSEDFGCFNTEEDNDSEVVCLDDDDDNNDVEAKNLGQPTLKSSLPSSNSTHPVSSMNINNEKRKLEDVSSGPQKRPCLETSHP